MKMMKNGNKERESSADSSKLQIFVQKCKLVYPITLPFLEVGAQRKPIRCAKLSEFLLSEHVVHRGLRGGSRRSSRASL